MITAVDSSVLLDIFVGDPTFMPRSLAAHLLCVADGELVACEVVWGEVSAFFPTSNAAREVLERINVRFSALTVDSALAAGAAWRDYRRRGGPRDRIISDFLIGAHALTQADRLLTRDRGFCRSYFRHLEVLDPTGT